MALPPGSKGLIAIREAPAGGIKVRLLVTSTETQQKYVAWMFLATGEPLGPGYLRLEPQPHQLPQSHVFHFHSFSSCRTRKPTQHRSNHRIVNAHFQITFFSLVVWTSETAPYTWTPSALPKASFHTDQP